MENVIRIAALLVVIGSGISIKAKDIQGKDQFQDWVEASAASYAGHYTGAIFPKDYTDKYIISDISIMVMDGKLIATYSSCYSTDDADSCKTQKLKKVSIKGNKFKASPVKKSGAVHVPKTMKGKFVKKFPPANAKGPVEQGLLLGGEFFVRSDSND